MTLSRYLSSVLPTLALCLILTATADDVKTTRSREPMESELQKIEALRSRYETELLQIEGVVAVSIGLCGDDRPCLKIGTARPVEQVRSRLPAGLSRDDVVVEYIGDIHAQ